MSDKLDIKDLAMPSAAKIIAEKKLDVSKIQGTGLQGRITKGDVLLYLNLEKNDDKLVSKNSMSNKIMSNRKDKKMDVLVPILVFYLAKYLSADFESFFWLWFIFQWSLSILLFAFVSYYIKKKLDKPSAILNPQP